MNERDTTRDDELGALWEKEGPKGIYWTGSVQVGGEKVDIVVFPNNYKTKENHPAYRILKSRPKEERTSTRRDEAQYQQPRQDSFEARDRSGTRPLREQETSRPGPARWPEPPAKVAPRAVQRPQQPDWTDDVPPVEDDGDVPF